jgi:hypothetical protein
MKSIKNIMICVVLSLLIAGCATTEHTSSTGEDFKVVAGYPTIEASEALYDEMDYQRAVQAYIWATPMLNSMRWPGWSIHPR